MENGLRETRASETAAAHSFFLGRATQGGRRTHALHLSHAPPGTPRPGRPAGGRGPGGVRAGRVHERRRRGDGGRCVFRGKGGRGSDAGAAQETSALARHAMRAGGGASAGRESGAWTRPTASARTKRCAAKFACADPPLQILTLFFSLSPLFSPSPALDVINARLRPAGVKASKLREVSCEWGWREREGRARTRRSALCLFSTRTSLSSPAARPAPSPACPATRSPT